MKTIRFLALGLLLASHGSLHAATPPAGKTQQLTTPDQVPEGLAKSDWASIRAALDPFYRTQLIADITPPF